MKYRYRFNPGLGFLPASTIAYVARVISPRVSNPVLGFLPASTHQVVRFGREDRVSIPFWVFSLLRLPAVGVRVVRRQRVSIPFWIFSLLRPAWREATEAGA